ARHRRKVGVADAGGTDADADLARADGCRRHVVTDVEGGITDLVQDCGLHSAPPSTGTSLSARARLGHESTASRTLSSLSSSGYSSWSSRLSSSSTSKTSGRIPTQTALASHSSWSTTIFIRPTAAVEHVPTLASKAGVPVSDGASHWP